MTNIDLRNGDCLNVLKELDDNSIDSIVTDPPYGLSFMGKKWDYDVPSIEMWKEQPLFGFGLKSFRVKCQDMINRENNLRRITPTQELAPTQYIICANHPHNYYLEILTETGIIGLSIVLIIALFFVIFIFKNLKVFKGNNIEHFFILAAAITLILELFPLKTSGSVFTTNDAAYIALISSIILSHKKILKAKNL